ncbi:MAG: type II toxin-antitoxin system RelE/ParE family toxin [Chloroflexota bacterium]|nr:type II toxin-antitoxin system RelE/ParE family toxin [Chloroflexota bacterium]
MQSQEPPIHHSSDRDALGKGQINTPPERQHEIAWAPRVTKAIRSFPQPVIDVILVALLSAMTKQRHRLAFPLKGFSGISVMEIKKPYDGDTYRVVYGIGVPLADTICVLDAFKKKSHRDDETPRDVMARINQRLKNADVMEMKDLEEALNERRRGSRAK